MEVSVDVPVEEVDVILPEVVVTELVAFDIDAMFKGDDVVAGLEPKA